MFGNRKNRDEIMVKWEESICFNCKINCCAGEPIHLLQSEWKSIAKDVIQPPKLFESKYHVLILDQCPFQFPNRACAIQEKKPYLCYGFPFMASLIEGGLEFSLTTECPNWERFATLNHFYHAVISQFYLMGFTANALEENPSEKMDIVSDFDKITSYVSQATKKKAFFRQKLVCLMKNRTEMLVLAKMIYRTKVHPLHIPKGIITRLKNLYTNSIVSGSYLLRDE